ncbi:MAG: prepilin-type N-terminal cleavage/methylation domain-containing protein [Patescibacteria group bacterium]
MKKFLQKLKSFAAYRKEQLGFTLVELLVVVSILAILVVVAYSAIKPVEQLKKTRDAAKKADATTLLKALDRYQVSFGCYPWAYTAGSGCGTTTLGVSALVVSDGDFDGSGRLAELLNQDELKSQFTSRNSVTGSSLYISETDDQVSICFTPESKTARSGNLGPVVTDVNSGTGVCSATPDGSHEATCNVCVPQ